MSVYLSEWKDSAPTGRIFMKFDIWVFFEKLSRRFKYHYKLTRITGTLCEDQYTFFIIFHSILLGTKNVSDKSCRENQTHILRSITFCRKSCLLWDNGHETERYRQYHTPNSCTESSGFKPRPETSCRYRGSLWFSVVYLSKCQTTSYNKVIAASTYVLSKSLFNMRHIIRLHNEFCQLEPSWNKSTSA